jgi:hypothetical protein
MAGNDERPPAKQSRLEREVEEILSKTGGVEEKRHQRGTITHLKPRPRRLKRAPRAWPYRDRLPSMGHLSNGALALIGSLACAILAVIVSGFSPLLANVFALLSVALLLAPFALQFRRPGGRDANKMWRGRVIDTSDTEGPNIIEQIRDRFFGPK